MATCAPTYSAHYSCRQHTQRHHSLIEHEHAHDVASKLIVRLLHHPCVLSQATTLPLVTDDLSDGKVDCLHAPQYNCPVKASCRPVTHRSATGGKGLESERGVCLNGYVRQ